MLVKINKVDNGGMVTDTRTESFAMALAITENRVKQSETGVKLFNNNNINDGWTVDVVNWQGNVTTYDFQPVMD